MKNILLLKLAVVTGLCSASQAFGLTWTATNFSTKPVEIQGEYALCRKDALQRIAPGETKTFDGQKCALTAITGHGPYGPVSPYKGRINNQFYIVEHGGELKVVAKALRKK